MRFERAILKDWLQSLIASTDAKDRCIGKNFLIEENVSDERRLELEAHNPELTDVEILFKSYYRIFVQGEIRGHVPSTFEMHKNFPALKAVAMHPARKLMRLECLDEYLLLEQDGFEFEELGSRRERRQSWSDSRTTETYTSYSRRTANVFGIHERYSEPAEEKGLVAAHHRLLGIASPLPIRS